MCIPVGLSVWTEKSTCQTARASSGSHFEYIYRTFLNDCSFLPQVCPYILYVWLVCLPNSQKFYTRKKNILIHMIDTCNLFWSSNTGVSIFTFETFRKKYILYMLQRVCGFISLLLFKKRLSNTLLCFPIFLLF